MLFSLIFPEKNSPNPTILSLFLEKLRIFLKEEGLTSLKQPQILEFLQNSVFLKEFREDFKEIFSKQENQDFDIFEPFDPENPKFKKFKNLDFCIKPHELIPEFSDNFQEISSLFPSKIINEEEILHCLGAFSKTYPLLEDPTQRFLNEIFENSQENPQIKPFNEKILEKRTINLNIESFLKTLDSSVKWPQILQKLDKKALKSTYKDPKSLTNLLKLVQKLRKLFNLPFPASFLFSKWQDLHSQIPFLINLFQIGVPELISWSEITIKRIISLDFNPALRYSTLTPPLLQFWCCLEFLELLVESSETEYFFLIRNLFEIPLQKCPDILIIGLSQIKPKYGLVFLEELFSNLFPLYLLNHSNSIPILEALWRYNEKLMIEAIYSLYKKENSSLNLSRVLDITQEIKDSLIPLTNCHNLNFSVSLGILASKREFLHFEHWLTERIRITGNPFITALLRYIEENVIIPCELYEKTQNQGNYQTNNLQTLEKAQMSLETLGIIMESFLGPGFDTLTVKNQKKAREVFASICLLFPALAGVSESSKLEIETATNGYFQKVFFKEMLVEEFVDLLQKLKNSGNPSEKEIYACMIHHLFDEFRHHEEYTMEILLITGSIYGNLINSKYYYN